MLSAKTKLRSFYPECQFVYLSLAEGERSSSILPADHIRRGLLSPTHDRPPRPQAGEPTARQESQCQNR